MKDQENPPRAPVQLFAAALGLTGLMLAWQHAEIAGVTPATAVPESLLAISFFVSTLVFVRYAAGAMRDRAASAMDIRTPAILVLLASGSMALMQLPAGFVAQMPLAQSVSSALWLTGAGAYAVCTVLFGVAVLRLGPGLNAITPAWFIPTVGMAVAPTAGISLGFTSLAAGMAIIGALAWCALLPFVVWRLARGPSLAARLVPSLCVLIAPAALISLALRAFDASPDAAALFFYVSAGFALLVLLMLLRRRADIQDEGFTYGWWSATFPLAALAGAAQLTFAASPTTGHLLAAQGFLGLATLVTAAIGVMTLRVIIQRR